MKEKHGNTLDSRCCAFCAKVFRGRYSECFCSTECCEKWGNQKQKEADKRRACEGEANDK